MPQESDHGAGGLPSSDTIPESAPSAGGEAAEGSASSAPSYHPSGTQIGRYVIVEILGRGGMGTVYAAWDPHLERRIALKLVTLRAGLGAQVQRRRLLREGQALARLEHPNVVRVHDVGVQDNQIFIAMEQITGQSLRRWLRAKARSLWAVLEVFIAAGRGLAAAHAADLVHRDFKPDNVLISNAGEVKVVDFGLAQDGLAGDDRLEDAEHPRTRGWAKSEPAVARALERAASESWPASEDVPQPHARRESSSSLLSRSGSGPHSVSSSSSSTGLLTAAGKVLGTPAYMAPEQHARARVDARADQYAFCVALWEAVYGKRPFSGSSANKLAKRKRALAIRESSRGLRVPKWLRSAMLRGLHPQPRRRHGGVLELVALLEFQLQRRRRWRVPVALALGASALALAAWALQTSTPPARTCAAPIERLEGVWDDERRAQLEARFLASELSYAEDSWARVSRALDQRTRAWLAAQVEVCEGAQLRQQHDLRWLERRLQCLDQRHAELVSLSAQLGRGDARTIERATMAVATLAPIESCTGERAAAGVPLPSDLGLRASVQEQLERLTRARAQIEVGDLDGGGQLARAVANAARLLGWAPLEAEAELLSAQLELQRGGDPDAAIDTLHRAASRALEGAHHELALRCWAQLVSAEAERGPPGLTRARLWLSYLEALAGDAELDQQPPLAALVHAARRDLAFAAQDYASAEREARAHLDLLQSVHGSQSPQVAEALNSLGITVYMQHRKDEALAAYEGALDILVAIHGPAHPSLAHMHNNIGVVATDRGDWDKAEQHYRRALVIRTPIYPPEHPLMLMSTTNLANLGLFSEQPARGLSAGAEVLRLEEQRLERELATAAARGASASELASVRVGLVDALLRCARLRAGVGEHGSARQLFARGLELLDAAPGTRLPPGFVPPTPHTRDWPARLEGCRRDLLEGLERSAEALGDSEGAAQARLELVDNPTQSVRAPRRCTTELARWLSARSSQ